MPVPELHKLREIIDAEVPIDRKAMIFKDAFALGCYLHLTGSVQAGRKMCSEVLSALGYEHRKTYFNQIMDNLEGNEVAYSELIGAHGEINDLFRRLEQSKKTAH